MRKSSLNKRKEKCSDREVEDRSIHPESYQGQTQIGRTIHEQPKSSTKASNFYMDKQRWVWTVRVRHNRCIQFGSIINRQEGSNYSHPEAGEGQVEDR